MHHSGGAYSESLYIYGRALTKIPDMIQRPVIMSLGLGLGYNELIVAEFYRAHSNKFFEMISYEKEEFLSTALLKMLGLLPNDLSTEIQQTYQKVFSYFSPECLANLKEAFLDGRWRIRGALSPNSYELTKVHALLWDAFSRKTSPELWDEVFLTDLFDQITSPDAAILSTYACNGPIKRALKAVGFEVTEMPGFQNKRQSLIATRYSLKGI